jgi:N4-gp56 family major capsid protein
MKSANLAVKYAKEVDERFAKASQAMLGVSSDYSFVGAETVNVYSIPVVAMNDYQRSGANRYGTPADLARNVQTMQVTKDRSFTFIIDKGDKLQSQMVSDAGKALAREIKEVWVPEFDAYVYKKLAAEAAARGNADETVPTRDNAYALFLAAMEKLGNANVPDQGRVCFCSYRFANLLKQDSAFMKYGDASQQMLVKGVIGEVDGCRIVKVPSGRLPAGCSFILTHPMAATAPRQLEDYKTHDNPPGISGWLVEGRVIYDCFILSEKACAVFYQGGADQMKTLTVGTAATDAGKSTVMLIPGEHDAAGVKWYYTTADKAANLTAAVYGTAITTSAWTELTQNGLEITPTAGHTAIRVVEVDAANKPIGAGTAVLNVG